MDLTTYSFANMADCRVMFGIGDVVKKLREAKEWTLDDLAAKSGVNRMTLSHLENENRDPRGSTISKVATALGFPNAGGLYSLLPAEPPRAHDDVSDAEIRRTTERQRDELHAALTKIAAITDNVLVTFGQKKNSPGVSQSDTAPLDAGASTGTIGASQQKGGQHGTPAEAGASGAGRSASADERNQALGSLRESTQTVEDAYGLDRKGSPATPRRDSTSQAPPTVRSRARRTRSR